MVSLFAIFVIAKLIEYVRKELKLLRKSHLLYLMEKLINVLDYLLLKI